jgi:hypothetical protein
MFGILGKDTRKEVLFTIVGDRNMAHIVLMLLISKPTFTNPAVISPALVMNGRSHATVFLSSWDFE